MLVFSPTSLLAHLINPTNPRAVFVNDSVEIAFVRGGEIIEVATQNADEGVVFFTLAKRANGVVHTVVRAVEQVLIQVAEPIRHRGRLPTVPHSGNNCLIADCASHGAARKATFSQRSLRQRVARYPAPNENFVLRCPAHITV